MARQSVSPSDSPSDDRLDDPRLAVVDVAERNTVGRRRARHPQLHDGPVAELRGPLEDAGVRAVVIRLVERGRDIELGGTVIP